MIEENIYKDIGALKAKCDALNARVTALTAFACAVLESHPAKDILLTQWADNLGPAMNEIGPGLDESLTKIASGVPGWVQGHSSEKYKS